MRVMTRQAGSHFPSAPLAKGTVASTHTVNCFTTGRRRLPLPLQSIDGVYSLFLSLPWSASLSVEGVEPFALTAVS